MESKPIGTPPTPQRINRIRTCFNREPQALSLREAAATSSYSAFLALPVTGINPTYPEWIAQQRAANIDRDRVGQRPVAVPVRVADFKAFCDERGNGYIGLHVGPVVAGIIGNKRFLYDLWGDTVNVASRMESASSPGAILVTSEVRHQLTEISTSVSARPRTSKEKA
jgi:hypothetical protein